jgi:tight adherence protein B
MNVLAVSGNLLLIDIVVFLAVVAFVLAFSGEIERWVARRRASAIDVQRQLHGTGSVAFMVFGPPVIAVLIIVLSATSGMLVLGVVIAVIAYKLLGYLPHVLVSRRQKKFDEQLPDSLRAMANSMKAGMSLPQAVAQVAKDMPSPTKEEFAEIQRAYEMGKPIEQAVDDARDRVRSRNFELAVTAFRVGEAQGGNLAEIFDRIADSIREIWRLEEHIRSISSQGRSSARFMSFMPGLFLILLYFMDPQGTMLLFEDPVGMAILSVVLLLNVLGHLWIRKILSVDI